MMTQHRSEHWETRTGFDSRSRGGVCSLTGQSFEGPVYRGPVIEEEGYFDVSEYGAQDLARHIGFLAPEVVEDLQLQLTKIAGELTAAIVERNSLRDQVRTLTLANAELYSQYEYEYEDGDDE